MIYAGGLLYDIAIPPELDACLLLYHCATTRSQLAHRFSIRAGGLWFIRMMN